MDLDEIKEIIEIDGGKFIIVENGRPIMVVTSFENYKNNLKLKRSQSLNIREESFKSVSPKKETPKGMPKELEDEELKIENLPF